MAMSSLDMLGTKGYVVVRAVEFADAVNSGLFLFHFSYTVSSLSFTGCHVKHSLTYPFHIIFML
jgi:hypothetical protein